jgi:hypothetical protein
MGCKWCEEHYLTGKGQHCKDCEENHRENCKKDVHKSTRVFDDEQAKALLSGCLIATREALGHVKDVLLAHGDVVLSRWKLLGREERMKVLIRASPTLFQQPDTTTTSSVPKLIRWLDSAAFSQDSMRLLSLLHLRSEHGPDRWAVFDTRSNSELCTQRDWPDYSYNTGAVIMHGERYGELVDFDPNSAHSWQQVGFPRALLTFQAQEALALALSAAVDILTTSAGSGGNSQWLALVSGGLRSADEEVLWSSYYHQEFATPAKFDPEVILEKAQNQLNNAVDEMELLQTDPEQMRQHVWDTKQHTYFPPKRGKEVEEDWTTVARVIVCGRTKSLTSWRRIVAESENLRATLAQFQPSTTPGARLSPEADTAMRWFGWTMVNTLYSCARSVLPMLRSINMMRDLFLRCERRYGFSDSGEPTVSMWTIRDCLILTRKPDQIMAVAMDIGFAVQYDWIDGLSHLLMKLKEKLQGVEYNKSVESWLSNMALLDEIHDSWRRHQMIGHHDMLGRDAIILDISARGNLPYAVASPGGQAPEVNSAIEDRSAHEDKLARAFGSDDVRCGQLMRAFCALPIPRGGKKLPWLNKMAKSREGLTQVWQCVREIMAGIGSLDGLQPDVLSQASFDMSIEYLSKVEAERQQIERKYGRNKTVEDQKQIEPQFEQQSWDIGAGEDSVVRRNLPKKSNALRKNTSIDDRLEVHQAPLKDIDIVTTDPAPVPQIEVNRNTLSLMAKMFPTGIDSTSSVRCTELVQALTDAGMTAEQSGGSAVNFGTQHSGSIVFHMPHPEPVVDAIRLRGFGKRLTKWFGWTNETFILRPKNGDELREKKIEAKRLISEEEDCVGFSSRL